MKKRLRILMDIDGVVADFMATALDIVEKLSGDRYHPTDFHAWDIFETIPREHELDFLDAFKVKGTCLGIPLIPGSKEGVDGLRARGDLYVVTSPMGCVETWSHERDAWLKQHFEIPTSKIIHTSAKYVCAGDWLIDDKPANITPWLEHNPNGKAMLWHHNYNAKEDLGPRVHRVHNWVDVFAILDAETTTGRFDD